MEQSGWSNSNSHTWKLKRGVGSTVFAHPWYLHIESLQTPRCIHSHSATCTYRNRCKTVYIWLEQKRKKKGEIVSSENHCCSSGLTTNAASFCTGSWPLGVRSQSQSREPAALLLRSLNQETQNIQLQKLQQTNLGIFPMQKVSLVSYTEKKVFSVL